MSNGIYRMGWGVAAVFALLFAASLAGIVQGGALDPPGTPASTMKSLDDIPGSWNRELSATGGCNSPRFDCVFADLAVLDRETGLVWERVPAVATSIWAVAVESCAELAINYRFGWRLPTFEEVHSLLELDGGDNLPAGHPFTVAASTFHWTATTNPGDATLAFAFALGSDGNAFSQGKGNSRPHWCVRGGQGIEGR